MLAKSIPPTDKNPIDHIHQNMINNIYFYSVTENETYQIIVTFKDSAAGWDNLKLTLITHIIESLTVLFAHICDQSFKTGYFPK